VNKLFAFALLRTRGRHRLRPAAGRPAAAERPGRPPRRMSRRSRRGWPAEGARLRPPAVCHPQGVGAPARAEKGRAAGSRPSCRRDPRRSSRSRRTRELEKELATFHKNVTLGKWADEKAYLASLPRRRGRGRLQAVAPEPSLRPAMGGRPGGPAAGHRPAGDDGNADDAGQPEHAAVRGAERLLGRRRARAGRGRAGAKEPLKPDAQREQERSGSARSPRSCARR
jgi:hypothetical protein